MRVVALAHSSLLPTNIKLNLGNGIKRTIRATTSLTILLLALLIASCSSNVRSTPYAEILDSAPQHPPTNLSKIPDAVPKPEKTSKYGNKTYSVYGTTYHVLKTSAGYDSKGIASWYGTKFDGHRTSNGERYSMYQMTAASKILPLPTYVQVTNLANGRQVIVKVNDRGPFHENRIIDVSYAAAYKLGMLPTGTALVEVKAINPKNYNTKNVTHVTPTKAHIYLQVAAFSQRDHADKLVKAVQDDVKEPVFIKTAGTSSEPLYRVWIGPLSNVSLSDSLYRKLKRQHLGKPFTVVD